MLLVRLRPAPQSLSSTLSRRRQNQTLASSVGGFYIREAVEDDTCRSVKTDFLALLDATPFSMHVDRLFLISSYSMALFQSLPIRSKLESGLANPN